MKQPTLTFLFLSLCLPALAAPSSPEVAVRGLVDGSLAVDQAVASWRDADLSADQALALIRGTRGSGGFEGEQALTDGFGRTSRMLVHVPDETLADGRYGVLIVLHGLGGKAEQLTRFGERIAPPGYLVVAPNAQRVEHEDENAEDTFGAGLMTRALQHWWSYRQRSFPLAALDRLKLQFPVDTDRIVLLGYSMGGYGAWNIGLRYPDRFAGIVPISGGISRRENLIRRDARCRPLVRNGVMVPSWFTHGNADRTVPFRFSQTLHEDLQGYGADAHFEPVEGGPHLLRPFLRGNESTQRLVAWLAQRVRDPHPRLVDHTVVGPYHGASYWLRIDEAGGAARAVAEVAGENLIRVRTEGVRRVTVFLDPALVDVSKPVSVEVNGVVMHQGTVASSIDAVAQSFADDRDPQLTYARAVTLDLVY